MRDDARPFGRVVFQLIRLGNCLEKDLDQFVFRFRIAVTGAGCWIWIILGRGVLAAWTERGHGWVAAVEVDFIRAGFYLTVQTKPIFVDFLNSLRLSALRVARIRMSVLI